MYSAANYCGWYVRRRNIDDHPTEGFLVSDESYSNNPNIETDENSVFSTQHTYVSIYYEDAAGAINYAKKSVK